MSFAMEDGFCFQHAKAQTFVSVVHTFIIQTILGPVAPIFAANKAVAAGGLGGIPV